MSDYKPFDQRTWLGDPPWTDLVAVKTWEHVHGHDVRLKCYPEFGCLVIGDDAYDRGHAEGRAAERQSLTSALWAYASENDWGPEFPKNEREGKLVRHHICVGVRQAAQLIEKHGDAATQPETPGEGQQPQSEPQGHADEGVCPEPIWDGPYRMECRHHIVKGRCVRHGYIAPEKRLERPPQGGHADGQRDAPASRGDLRLRIVKAMNTSHCGEGIAPEPHSPHHYEAFCNVCRGDTEALADAVLAVCDEELERLRSIDEERDSLADQLAQLTPQLAAAEAKLAELRTHVDRLDRWCRDGHASATIAGSIVADMRKTLDGEP